MINPTRSANVEPKTFLLASKDDHKYFFLRKLNERLLLQSYLYAYYLMITLREVLKLILLNWREEWLGEWHCWIVTIPSVVFSIPCGREYSAFSTNGIHTMDAIGHSFQEHFYCTTIARKIAIGRRQDSIIEFHWYYQVDQLDCLRFEVERFKPDSVSLPVSLTAIEFENFGDLSREESNSVVFPHWIRCSFILEISC